MPFSHPLSRARWSLLLVLLLLLALPALAQEATPEATPETTALPELSCAARMQATLAQAARACAATGIDEVCYGGGRIELDARAADFEADRFDAPADLLSASEVFALTLLPLTEDQEAGIAVLRPRANLPESALTMVAVGEVRMQNVSAADASFLAREVTVRRGGGANVREVPSPDGAVLGAYYWGQALTALGRTDDGEWLRVLADGRAGWVLAQLVTGDFDFAQLAVTTPDDTPVLYAPFQAFDLNTNMGDSPCPDDLAFAGPESGVLVQTPDLARAVTLVINNLPLRFTGTLYLQGGQDTLHIQTLEGDTEISGALFAAQQPILTLGAGESAVITLDADGLFAGYPDRAEPYAFVRARRAPLALLPRPITLPFSTVGLFRTFEPNTGFLQNLPVDGLCVVAWSVGVNIRQGPGTEFPIWAALPGGYAGQPDARAVGSDGLLWWRFAPDVWLNSNPTGAAGQCGLLPLLDTPAR